MHFLIKHGQHKDTNIHQIIISQAKSSNIYHNNLEENTHTHNSSYK